MKRLPWVGLAVLSIGVLVLTSCAPKLAEVPPKPASVPQVAAPAKTAPAPEVPVVAAWERDWQAVVDGARKEGRVIAYLYVGAETRQALARAFANKYGVRLESITAREWGAKILSERRAGIHSTDLAVGGTTTMLTQMKPEGALESLESALILPEVIDGKAWLGGALPWVDSEHQGLSFISYVNNGVAINTDLAKRNEIQTYSDLLDPKWRGKIVMTDPTLPGSGLRWFGVVSTKIKDLEFMRKLAEQKPLIVADERLAGEWVARSKYPLAIGIKSDVISNLQEAGAPILSFTPEKEKGYITTGSGNVCLLKGAPHPNAAKLFINWLLSREGQAVWMKADRRPSTRIDVAVGEYIPPALVPDPKKQYVNSDAEEFLLQQKEQAKLAKDIFGHLMK